MLIRELLRESQTIPDFVHQEFDLHFIASQTYGRTLAHALRAIGMKLPEFEDDDLVYHYIRKPAVAKVMKTRRAKIIDACIALHEEIAETIRQTYFVHGGRARLNRIIATRYDLLKAMQRGKRDSGIFWAHDPFDPLNPPFDLGIGFEYNHTSYVEVEPQGNEQPRNYNMTVLAGSETVDWPTTIQLFYEFRDFEQEIRLLPDQPLTLERLRVGDIEFHEIEEVPLGEMEGITLTTGNISSRHG